MMKIYRVFFAIIAFFVISTNVCFSADELHLDRAIYHQRAVMETGFRILNANNYDKRMTFYYTTEAKPKIKISNRNKSITVTKGVMPFIDNEDEMAAVLSTAIASVMDAQNGLFRRFSISFSPRKYEIKADKKAVDLMVNAGYNPVGLINLINKTDNEASFLELNIFHHKGSERTAYIYHYIYEKYPLFIAKNEYFENPIYQNFLHTTKSDRKKVRVIQQEKLNLKKTKKETLNDND